MVENCDRTSLTKIHSFCAQEKSFDPSGGWAQGLGFFTLKTKGTL